MIDQERHSTFTGELSHYTVTLAMKDKNLVIKVSDNETLHKFYGCISQQFIDSQDKFFTVYFECPEDVFIHLSEHFQQTVIENGIIRFNYESGKKLQVREVVVELVKEKVDENTLAHVKIAKMKDHFTAQLKQRDTQIIALSKEVRDNREIANQFKRENQEKMRIMQEKIQKEHIYSRGLEEKIQKLLEKMQKQQNYSKMLEERLQMQERNIKEIEEKLKKQQNGSKFTEEKFIGQQLESLPSKTISHHPNNAHQQYYTLTNYTATSVKLARVGGGSNWYNFVNKTEVLAKQHNKYTIRMVKVKESLLCIGFCTEKGLGVTSNHFQAESVYYDCYRNGWLFENGSNKQLSGCGCVDGDVVEVLLDLLEWRICWKKSGKVLGECVVPASMKGKPIYLSISQHSEGDAVQVTSL